MLLHLLVVVAMPLQRLTLRQRVHLLREIMMWQLPLVLLPAPVATAAGYCASAATTGVLLPHLTATE